MLEPINRMYRVDFASSTIINNFTSFNSYKNFFKLKLKPWFKMLFLMIICKRKYLIRGNNICFRLISLFKADFTKST